MSQSGLTDPSRQSAWDEWYVDHLRIMRTVNGISSAQRFITIDPGHPPSLAMYSIASAEVFQDPYYLSVRGMGEWKPLIDQRYYRRNLFEGLEYAPIADASQVLVVADRERSDPSLPLIWLTTVGLDRSTPVRGIAVMDEQRATSLRKADVAVYKPVTF